MRLSTPFSLLALAGFAQCQSTSSESLPPGYFTNFTNFPANKTLSFGSNFALLNLDLIVSEVATVNSTAPGQQWINSTANWIDAVRAKCPDILQVFTRICFTNSWYPDVKNGTALGEIFHSPKAPNMTESSPLTQIWPKFKVAERDVVLSKIRYDASYATELLPILRAQNIDTVILSGIRTSGVILNTAYTLYDEDYRFFVIADNSIETPEEGTDAQEVDKAIKTGIIPKLPGYVITLNQAMKALEHSG